jgi:hypothetical protein
MNTALVSVGSPTSPPSLFLCSLLRILAVLLAFLGPLPRGLTQSPEAKSGLVLALATTPTPTLFRVELHNTGDQDLILNLGMMLGNGKKQYADRIRLLLTDPHGKLLHLEVTGPALIAGRVDPMVVPLPVGATFVLPIDLKDYSAPKEKIWALDLTPGEYTLRAEYTGIGVRQREANLDMQGISLMSYWTGAVDSNTLPFTLTQEIGPTFRLVSPGVKKRPTQ